MVCHKSFNFGVLICIFWKLYLNYFIIFQIIFSLYVQWIILVLLVTIYNFYFSFTKTTSRRGGNILRWLAEDEVVQLMGSLYEASYPKENFASKNNTCSKPGSELAPIQWGRSDYFYPRPTGSVMKLEKLGKNSANQNAFTTSSSVIGTNNMNLETTLRQVSGFFWGKK